MNRDDIIRWAREAGAAEPSSLYGRTDYVVMTQSELERLAALVYEQVFKDANYAATRAVTDAAIALEREACAKLCESAIQQRIDEYNDACQDCANAIRARNWK